MSAFQAPLPNHDILKDGWHMKDIDEMDMIGYLHVRAWDARREYDKVHVAPKKVYIDEVWPVTEK